MNNFIEFSGVGKSFPGVRALSDVSFKVEGGKVTALLGENGAGKSTLLKIMSGDLKADEGTFSINGEMQQFSAPVDALRAGISVIYQERQLVPMLSVMENIFLDDIPCRKRLIIDRREMYGRAKEIIEKFGLSIDPREEVGHLSVAHQQMVEIMKAYRRNSRIIAFDEPTAPLDDDEIATLFELIAQLRDEGKVIIYISHRLAEIFQITDEIVVLKDGRLVKTLETAKTTNNELINAMTGRNIGDTFNKLDRCKTRGDVVLKADKLCNKYIKDVSFELQSGEVLGFYGLVGSGRTETVRAVFAADPLTSGDITVKGKKVSFRSPKDAIAAGLALCPEDRKEQGLILLRNIAENTTIPVLKKISKGLFLNIKREEEIAAEAIQKYAVKTPSSHKTVGELSGGNQQKVILGRWTNSAADVDILILDEPTKGIDVGTKAEIYQTVCDLAKTGLGVVFISSELPEVLGVADRIIVMHEGSVAGSIMREDATEEKVLTMAMHG